MRSLGLVLVFLAAMTEMADGQGAGLNAPCGPSVIDADAAIESCTRFIESGELSGVALARVYLGRILAYEVKGDHEHTIADATKVIELTPDDTLPYVFRGGGYLETAAFDRAIEDFTRIVELQPKSDLGYALRSDAYSRKGEHDRAIADATKAIELDAKRPQNFAARALAYLRAGKPGQGLADANMTVELSPDSSDHAFHVRAQILEALGRRDEAIADYRRALRLAPANKVYQDALKRFGAAP
jgi:tetratricopeptide (TPR) repeat protein